MFIWCVNLGTGKKMVTQSTAETEAFNVGKKTISFV